MAAATTSPVEVGARGTVASLVSREIEYFRKLDLGQKGSPRTPKPRAVGDATATSSSSAGSRHRLARKKKNNKYKKKNSSAGSGGGFLPSICSAVEIAESRLAQRVVGEGYRSLRADAKGSDPTSDDGF